MNIEAFSRCIFTSRARVGTPNTQEWQRSMIFCASGYTIWLKSVLNLCYYSFMRAKTGVVLVLHFTRRGALFLAFRQN